MYMSNMFCTSPIYFLDVQTSSEIVPWTSKSGTFMRLYFFFFFFKLCYWITMVHKNFLALRSSYCPTTAAISKCCLLSFEVFSSTVPPNFPLCWSEISAYPFRNFSERFRFSEIKDKNT